MSDYCTITHVQGRVAGRTIDTTTKPTQAQVEIWIAGADGMLLGSLRAAGCNLPAAVSEGGYQLREWICDYVEGRVRLAWAASIDESSDGMALIEAFRKLTEEDIPNNGSWYCAMLNGGAVSDSGKRVRSYIMNNNDDKTIEDGDFDPIFERDEAF